MTNDFVLSRRSHPIRFLTLWVLANLAGGYLVGFLENNGFQFMATLILSGAIIGSFQWLLLRRLGGFRWWPIASALGWIAAVYLDMGIRWLYVPLLNQIGLSPSDEGFLLNLGLSRSVWISGMAIAQGVAVRPQRCRWTGVWLLSSLLGGAVATLLSRGLCATFCAALPPSLVGLVAGAGWAAYGLITGLVWLFLSGRHSDRQEAA